jgi:hypothetical protein
VNLKLARGLNLRATHGNTLIMRRSAVPVPRPIDLAKMNELGLTILEASDPHACDGIAAISSPVPNAAGLPTAARHYQPPGAS